MAFFHVCQTGIGECIFQTFRRKPRRQKPKTPKPSNPTTRPGLGLSRCSVVCKASLALALNWRFTLGRPMKTYFALCLQLGQTKLPTQKQACALATACKSLPRSLPQRRICVAWTQQLEALSQQDPPFKCSPSDLEQAVRQLGRMSSQDGSFLIEYVITLCGKHIQPDAH